MQIKLNRWGGQKNHWVLKCWNVGVGLCQEWQPLFFSRLIYLFKRGRAGADSVISMEPNVGLKLMTPRSQMEPKQELDT